MDKNKIIKFVGDHNGKTVNELIDIWNSSHTSPTDKDEMDWNLDIPEIKVYISGMVRLSSTGIYAYCRDIIPMDSMGDNNPRKSERQTLYGDVLDWLRDQGFGKDDLAAKLLIGDYAVRHMYRGETQPLHNTYESKLCDLGNEAFRKAKERLKALGGRYEFERTHTLYIDTCEDSCVSSQFYILEVKKVILEDDTLMMLANLPEEREKQIIEGCEDERPDEVWFEGGMWYAEWEGLFEVIDIILDTTVQKYRLVATRDSASTDPLTILSSFQDSPESWRHIDNGKTFYPGQLGYSHDTTDEYLTTGDGKKTFIYQRIKNK